MNTNWVILKSIVFPMINLVWLGMTVMALGFLISMIRRYKENKRTAVNEN
jgi:cytochrome c-type biogenesis protein CcmF